MTPVIVEALPEEVAELEEPDEVVALSVFDEEAALVDVELSSLEDVDEPPTDVNELRLGRPLSDTPCAIAPVENKNRARSESAVEPLEAPERGVRHLIVTKYVWLWYVQKFVSSSAVEVV